NILVSNMAYDLSRAVELRILPSYLYTPQYAYESVTFEFLYVNLDQATNFDYMSQFNPGIFQTELKKLNPNIQWNYYLSEWDWTSNSAFSTIVNNAWDHPNRFIDFTQIRNYLKANYQNMFNTSTSNNLVIPVFNFALPDLYMSSFGGIADSINGEFVFVINIGTYAFIKSGYTITSLPSAMVSTPVNLNTNWYTYANITAGWGGDYVFETNITINSGSMNFYLLDQYNFDQLQLGNSINPIYSSSGLGIGLHSFNLTDFHIKNQYYWIFYATSDTTSFTYRIDRYLDRTFGYTSLALHESGHAVGLSHTHDGFSWNFQSTGMTEYVDWLWDQSYAIMSYIGLPFTLSKVEIDNAQRAIIPKLLDDFILQVNQLNQTIAIHDYIPSEYYLIYENSIDKINQAINNFVIHSYNRSLELIYQGFSLLDEFEFQIDQSLRNINLQISGLDGFPNTETVQVQIWIDGVLIIDELINENTLYVLNNVYWTTYDVIIIYNSVTEYEYHGYTWEISDIMLNLIFPSDDNSSSSSQPSSLLNNSSSSNSGTNILNTDNSSEVPSPFIFYPSIFYIFITLFVFQVFRRKQRN
ncbi:MAG: hypothetical protein OEZ01_04980, partial [Candidatus Heimdallarchaeota archaeon]|nr:hypothetical protein [Candidatus Heimdallarchaeota archaeon]